MGLILISRLLFMAVKLRSLVLTKRIPNWILFSKASASSVSRATMKYQDASHEEEENRTINPPFYEESKFQLLKSNLHPDNLVSVLDSTPDLNSSLKLFRWASLQRGFHHTEETYCAMISKLGMAGELDEMEGFCREMVREKFLGLEMKLLSLIDSFVANNRLSEGLRVLKVMNVSSFKPTIGVINCLMGALVEGKRDLKDVVFAYKEMAKAEILPNTETSNHLIDALIESGRVDTALDQYRRMCKKGCDPNVRTYEILIDGLVHRNMVDEALDVLNDMVYKRRCEANSKFYDRVIPLFCGLRNLEVASWLFKRMKARKIIPDSATYGAMIKCLCEHLRLDEAIEIYEDMIERGLEPDHQVYLDVITGFCEINKFVEAQSLLQESDIFDASLYNILLKSCCDCGNFTVAKGLFLDMYEENITDTESWNIFIRFLGENVQVNKALECLGRMFTSSFAPNSDTYSAIILAYCRSEKLLDALDLFLRMRSKRWALDSLSYAEFIQQLCENGDIKDAFEVFNYMSEKGSVLQSNAFDTLIEKLCTNGGISSAIKLLCSSSASVGVSTTTYNSIMRSLLKSGQGKNQVTAILPRMIVNGCDFDAETYCLLIESTISAHRIGESIHLFNAMLRSGLTPDAETLSLFLRALAGYSLMHAVVSAVKEKLVDFLDSTMYNVVVSSLWREGYRREAEDLLDVMLAKGFVPSEPTHGLLMKGSVCNDEVLNLRDGVSCILEEGLKEMPP